jgi:hypothetical protein
MKQANMAPIYACMYPELAEQARSAGWALAVHGTMGRDFDLVYVPWVRDPVSPKTVVQKACNFFAIEQFGEPVTTYHGRQIFTVNLRFGEAFLDMSFMPTEGATSAKD